VIEVAPGNTYDFAEGDTVSTGVSIKVNSTAGSGYNDLTVKRYDYAPLKPEFLGPAPRVEPLRMVFEQTGLTGFEADVQFDVDAWRITNPESVLVYHREFEGRGLFVPLATSYNPVKNIVVATTTLTGEFILTTPGIDAPIFTPQPVYPADSASVNQTQSVALEWAPIGRFDGFDLQVALDESFTDLIVDEEGLTSTQFELDDPDDEAVYFWRVRSYSNAGLSAWSEPSWFSTTAPFIEVTSPPEAPGEGWYLGMDYYIRWTDNIEEDVVIELHRHDSLVDTIAITPSDGAFEWEVDLGLPVGPGYWVKLYSSTDPSIVDSGDEFGIGSILAIEDKGSGELPATTVLRGSYPNPFSRTSRIELDVARFEHIRLSIHDVRGRLITVLVDQPIRPGTFDVTFDASGLPDGVYFCTLETPSLTQTRKVVLVK
jgi:hypothetical protein